MHTLKIRRIGNSGATWSKTVLQALNVSRHLQKLHFKLSSTRVSDSCFERSSQGDSSFLTETPNGVQITAYDPDFEAAMQAFAETRKNYSNAFRELAK
ncbi:AbrB/MazE/SpoVT family DNA-binding domain-containing protein [Funiculus sociatus GB2-A5]|uniref:AbrB/MazE/SpoVT family DNA-binding domain-containing protein n=1 Tax=Funiculus sociatus GB2-A5 TaxID=2933946 RepID=A0ABV0JWH3_9CYAN|nr:MULTISPECIES: AbrB/MazE/SpoVT family DNA-binding domain-containing protein [unclassified Trichocoleus]MBD1903951.1 AbrB/MazE/SpoVT family DNA-binding domain-containing protein [Trichocoleus sp. FACHB-832]MBD2006818.1 AbrB/MazE/SpoVT family DNA-binding domain-containing protein [Trichocoleus sp. FACHB-40]MBD2061832.1 AbrB/MazE/SpoVT family DNA-binding domain-containing protein [Trichocoleus sp. FACHB-6]